MIISNSNIAVKSTKEKTNVFSPLLNGKKFFIETFGCQMNFSDSEIVKSILIDNCYLLTKNAEEADLIFLNTCAIRENAEERVFKRAKEIKHLKDKNPELVIGILGCMSESSVSKFDDGIIDIFAGPDSYRKLPELIKTAEVGAYGINTELSLEETYQDLVPHRDNDSISAYISIMRGCNNYCSYCVVPKTRGRERSRNPNTIISEVEKLVSDGYKEIILLGQNVNSYIWESPSEKTMNFPGLLTKVANISQDIRVRFTTSHPKDLNLELLDAIASNENICNHIHLPVQSGSSRILKLMNRKYHRKSYINLVNEAKKRIPDLGITTDIIAGFCDESEEDHKETLSLMNEVKFDQSYMFMYSEREQTFAAEEYKDNVDKNIKKRRLNEIIATQSKHSLENNKNKVGWTFEILIDGYSKRSKKMFKGRTSQNIMVVFPSKEYQIGEYVNVLIKDCTSATLIGEIVK